MCEQNSDTLERTIQIIDDEFGKYISKMKWINFGGGHHITKPGYDIEKLIKCIMFFKNKYGVEVYIEPGEAIALNAGYLVASVLDTYGKRNENCHFRCICVLSYARCS